MRKLLIISALLFTSHLFSQVDTLLASRERQLLFLLKDLRSATTDSEKEVKNLLYKEYLLETIKMKDVMEYPFSQLTSMGSIMSEDKKIRLFNWNVEQEDQTQKYYCYILRFDRKKNTYLVSELIDNSFMIPERPEGVLDGKDWYGALYYKIIPISKGNKEMYTLLGLDMNTTLSNIKLIDVLTFSGNNPKLGSPIFKNKGETLKRVFFEHSKKAYMSLRYEVKYNRIIFDHLSPESPSMEGYYCYYVPDFIYDAYVFEKDKWVLQEDVIGINEKEDEKVTIYVQNVKTGKLERKEVKDKWIAPSETHSSKVPDQPGVDNKNGTTSKKTFNLTKIFSRTPKSPEHSMYPQDEMNGRKHRKKDHQSH